MKVPWARDFLCMRDAMRQELISPITKISNLSSSAPIKEAFHSRDYWTMDIYPSSRERDRSIEFHQALTSKPSKPSLSSVDVHSSSIVPSARSETIR